MDAMDRTVIGQAIVDVADDRFKPDDESDEELWGYYSFAGYAPRDIAELIEYELDLHGYKIVRANTD